MQENGRDTALECEGDAEPGQVLVLLQPVLARQEGAGGRADGDPVRRAEADQLLGIRHRLAVQTERITHQHRWRKLRRIALNHTRLNRSTDSHQC